MQSEMPHLILCFLGLNQRITDVICLFLLLSPVLHHNLTLQHLDIAFYAHMSAKRRIGVPMTLFSPRNRRHFKAVVWQYIVCTPDFGLSLIRMNSTSSTEIATTIHELEGQKVTLESDPAKLGVLFKEMIQMCLWWVHLDICPRLRH